MPQSRGIPLTDHVPGADPLYRFSTLGRRLDPAWPTNLAVLILMPLVGILAAALAPVLPGLAGTGRLMAAGMGAGVVLGVWALGRELAPDDQVAAFVAMALGLGALAVLPGASVALLFATLMWVRVVNRSVGLPAKTLDGVAVLVLSGWAMASTRSFGVGLLTAGAFALDATLAQPNRRQWGFAALALAMTGVLAVQGVEGNTPTLGSGPEAVLAAVAAALYVRATWRTRLLVSVGDATGTPLDPTRVRWGMVLALLVAIQAAFAGTGGLTAAAFVWAAVAGVGLSAIAPSGARPDGA